MTGKGSEPLVSVIIPCFNAEAWIRDTLKSVADQGVRDVEIVVVDDGSTDNSASIVQREFERVVLVKTSNLGASHARNLGTEMARGLFYQYLDADDLLAPGKLRVQLSALETMNGDVAYGGWQELQGRASGGFLAGRVVDRLIEGEPELALFTNFWCPPAAYLFRREVVKQVGGWNENLPIIQDARFVLDCALHGARFVYCPGVMAHYRVHPFSSLSRRDPIAFVRDCLRNANEVEAWWMEQGGLSPERRGALVKVYSYVARASFARDRLTFEDAYRRLEVLSPGYMPTDPWHLAAVAHIVGYRRAEAAAVWYRRVKRFLSR
jgi:glycosyltransferase involved in cell wall biosynthesis